MFLLLGISLSLLTAGGVVALLCNRSSRWAHRIGCFSAVTAALCAAAASFYSLFKSPLPELCESPVCYWFFDELSALFMVPVAVVGALAAIHSTGYLRGHDENKAGVYWFFFGMTLAAMFSVLLMVTPLTFLLAWELMGIFSFALVAYEYRSVLTRRAAWIYLLACEAGGLALILAFSVMQREQSWIVFLLLMIGFGLKAGLPLLHVWLPVAHPAAPAPVSAVMSASMINLGLYGILKFMPASGVSFAVCGWSLLICGMLCSLPGVIFALAQKNLKRLLAYSSIENMGIICLGLGLGFLGFSTGNIIMGCSGFCGAFLHIFNHGTLKSSLFLLAGSVYKATGTLDIDRMGGLMKRMPVSGALFTFSGISISGIPPFNGFLGEFLIYVAAFGGITSGTGGIFFVMSLAAMIVLALVGGVAAGAFVKAIGGVFLGEPRSTGASDAVEVPWNMTLPVVLAGSLSVLLVFFAATVCSLQIPVISRITGLDGNDIAAGVIVLGGLLDRIGMFAIIAIFFFVSLLIFRRCLDRGRTVAVRGTWDCGYAAPDSRMEYTGTAFVQPLCDLFRSLLSWKKITVLPNGLFPEKAEIKVATTDPAVGLFWRPLFKAVAAISGTVRRMQSGYLHLYILIMVGALILMLLWGFFGYKGAIVPSASKEVPAGKVEVKK